MNPGEVEKMWGEYSQAMAISGPTADGAIRAAVQVMTNHPPMALLRVSRRRPMPGPGGGGRVAGIGGADITEGHIRMGAFVGEVLRYAYGLAPAFPQNRIIAPLELQRERFDYVDTRPQGGKEVLQRALKDQFGIVARREKRENLVLIVKNPALIGPRRHADGDDKSVATIAQLAKMLKQHLGVEITDQTGLVGEFDLHMSGAQTPDEIKAAVLDQLGLDLAPAGDHQPVEFLIAEKVR